MKIGAEIEAYPDLSHQDPRVRPTSGDRSHSPSGNRRFAQRTSGCSCASGHRPSCYLRLRATASDDPPALGGQSAQSTIHRPWLRSFSQHQRPLIGECDWRSSSSLVGKAWNDSCRVVNSSRALSLNLSMFPAKTGYEF